MNDNIIQLPAQSEAESLIAACEEAGVIVHVKTDNEGVFPLFELYGVADVARAMSAMMALKQRLPDERLRIDMTNYAFSVGATLIDGYVVPPLWCEDGGAKVVGGEE